MTNKVPGWLHSIKESDVEELLRSHKGIVREFAQWISEPRKVEALQEEITRLAQENLRLRTVMLAAHEEIGEYWDAHCDTEGFGPQNLMRHLRDGTGYYPGLLPKVAKRETAQKVDIVGLVSITEEPLEGGGARFIFEIEDDKVDQFYRQFGLEKDDNEGFQRVVRESLEALMKAHNEKHQTR